MHAWLSHEIYYSGLLFLQEIDFLGLFFCVSHVCMIACRNLLHRASFVLTNGFRRALFLCGVVEWYIVSMSHVCLVESKHEILKQFCSEIYVVWLFWSKKTVVKCAYGAATVSRIDRIIGLICRISSLL